jgi:hypothetical protein
MIRLYSEGCGDVEVCKDLKIPYKEFQRRERDEKLFRELVEFGRLARKAWWLEIGRKAAKNGAASQAFNFWYSFMKNEFGWSEKVETKEVGEMATTSTDELKQKIAQKVRQIKGVPSAVELGAIMDGLSTA